MAEDVKALRRLSNPVYVRSQPIGLSNSATSVISPVKSFLPRSHTTQFVPSPSHDAVRSFENLDKPAYQSLESVHDLPSNPLTWRPSQLATFLAHILKLGPKALLDDVIKVVVSSRLSGKRFIRLTEEDFHDMGINVSWRKLFKRTQDRLRTECIKNGILTPQDFDIDASTSKGELGLTKDDSEVWKHSWRRSKGKHSRGRVRGIAKSWGSAQQIAEILSQPSPYPVPSMRASTSHPALADEVDVSDAESDISADEISASIDWSKIAPLSMSSGPGTPQTDHFLPNLSFSASSEDDTPSQKLKEPFLSRITERGSEFHSTIKPQKLFPQAYSPIINADTFLEKTAPSDPLDLFGPLQKPLPEDEDLIPLRPSAIVTSTAPNAKGSMLLVPRRDLEALQTRIAELEADRPKSAPTEQKPEERPKVSTSDLLRGILGRTGAADTGEPEVGIAVWTALAVAGIGLVVGEVAFKSLFRR